VYDATITAGEVIGMAYKLASWESPQQALYKSDHFQQISVLSKGSASASLHFIFTKELLPNAQLRIALVQGQQGLLWTLNPPAAKSRGNVTGDNINS
jgi:hypothetical protein